MIPRDFKNLIDYKKLQISWNDLPPHQQRRHEVELRYYYYCIIITFCVSRRRRKMYCGHARLCVSLSVCVSVWVSAAVRPHYCADPDVTWAVVEAAP